MLVSKNEQFKIILDDIETAKLLEEKGVNMDEKDMEGNTALDIAEMNDQTEMSNYCKGQMYFKQVQVTSFQFQYFEIHNIVSH